MVTRNAFDSLALDTTVAAVRDGLAGTVGDGGARFVTGSKVKFRDGFTGATAQTPVDPTLWTLVNNSPDTGDGRGHLVIPGGDSQGSAYLRISLSPFVTGSGVELASVPKFAFPLRASWGVSVSQRNSGQEVVYGFAEADPGTSDPAGLRRITGTADLPIVGTVTTNGSTATVNVPAHGLKGGDRVVLVGNSERRLDIGPAYIVVVDRDNITVPSSLAAGTYPAGGVVRLVDPLAGAYNGAAYNLGDTTSSGSGTIASRRAGTKYRVTTGQGMAPSYPSQLNSSPYSDAWLPSGPCELWGSIDEVAWRSFTDGNGGTSGYNKFQSGVPDDTASYRLNLRARNLDNLSVPVARITSAVKSGSNTATITTDVAHGLATGDQVAIAGVRDQTNFAGTNTAIVSVPSTTTFTVSFGASATATDTYGGTVYLNRGGVNAPGALSGGNIQSIASTSSGVMAITGNNTVTGLSPGDYVQVHGLAPGNTAYEGAFKVLRLNGSVLEVAWTGATFASITTGGTLIRRTDVRLHFARVLDYSRILTEIVGGRGNASDSNNAVPTMLVNTPYVQVQTGIVEGAPLTSAALGASSTYTQITVDTGGSGGSRHGSVRVLVSHTAGTTPGHLALETSADNTTWRETHRTPVPSDGAYHTVDWPLTHRWWRLKFYNGSTAQTAFWLGYTAYRGEPSRDLSKVLTFPLTSATGTIYAANGSSTTTTIDLGTNHSWATARASAINLDTAASGQVVLQYSMDGATWRWQTAVNVAAAANGDAVGAVSWRYLRVAYVNGATAATAGVVLGMTLVSL